MIEALKWKRGRNPGVIFAELNKSRKQEKNKVSYTASVPSEYDIVILSSISINSDLAKRTVLDLIRSVLFEPTKDGSLSQELFLKRLNNKVQDKLSERSQPYFLVTSMSYEGTAPLKWTGTNSCRVFFGLNPDRFYGEPNDKRNKLQQRLKRLDLPNQTRAYQIIVARTYAISTIEAFESALDAIDEIRGLMNLLLNSRTNFRWSSGARQPVNALRLGKMHTLHLPDGSLATTEFGYEPEFIEPKRLVNMRIERRYLRSFLKSVKKKSASSGLKYSAREGVIRYTRALDRRDWRVSFQELWSTLEYLTATFRERYDVTIRRTAGMYREYEVELEMIKHLRDVRNEIVHTGIETPNIESLMYQLKKYVERLLFFYIWNPFHLKNQDEIAQFLDAPKDTNQLRRNQQILNAAALFRSKR